MRSTRMSVSVTTAAGIIHEGKPQSCLASTHLSAGPTISAGNVMTHIYLSGSTTAAAGTSMTASHAAASHTLTCQSARRRQQETS